MHDYVNYRTCMCGERGCGSYVPPGWLWSIRKVRQAEREAEELFQRAREREAWASGWDCTCGAPEGTVHTAKCGVTPIYAGVVADLDPFPADNHLFVEAMLSRRTPPPPRSSRPEATLGPTVGVDTGRPGELVTRRREAMLVIDTDARAVIFHPDLSAYGDTEGGWLVVPGWAGVLWYERGQGNCYSPAWSACIGDAVCEAIERGEIPLRPVWELPGEYCAGRPGVAARSATAEPEASPTWAVSWVDPRRVDERLPGLRPDDD